MVDNISNKVMEEIKYIDILKANKQSSNKMLGESPYRVKVLNNITCNQMGEMLKYNLFEANILSTVEFGEYDNIVQNSQNCFNYDLVIIHYDLMTIFEKHKIFVENISNEDSMALVSSLEEELRFIFNNLSRVPLLIFNSFTDSAIYQNPIVSTRLHGIMEKLNSFVREFEQTNLFIVDINQILMKIGIDNAFDIKLYTLSKTLYTARFWMQYTYTIATIIFKIKGKLKKAIVFDCDNTLWNGILGEDGFDGIDMSISSKKGYYYHKVQQIVQWLASQGIIVGLCSKNNPDDVEEVIERHSDFCLTNDDIVIKKVNWSDKATNLKQIANDLNIGKDSIIFVDDSDFEISLVNKEIPEILTFKVPTNIIEYPSKLLELINHYFILENTQSDKARTLQYKQQIRRNEEKKRFSSIDSYLESLDIKISIKENDETAIERIAQLTQKTNQFNLTTHRYTDEQIKELMSLDKVLSISVEDKFGDNGLTGVIIYKTNYNTADIDSFIMSCRIMGRNIEKAIMNYLIEILKKIGINKVVAHYIPTKKNIPVKELYEGFGFAVKLEQEDSKDYELLLDNYIKQKVEYIKIN